MSRQKDHNAHLSSGGGEVPHTVLPQNLAASLKHLPEHDIMRLAEALAVEMGSRGLTAAKETTKPQSKRVPDPVLSQLTRSQISLIQSSIKAGVKPAALSRQFGITRAQITAVLKAGT
jgi:hypothetical protein